MPTATVVLAEDVAAAVDWEAIPRPAYDALRREHLGPDGMVPQALYDPLNVAMLTAAVQCVRVDGETIADPTPDEIAQVYASWPADAIDALLLDVLTASAPGSLEWARAWLKADARVALEVATAARAGLGHSVWLATWSTQDQTLAMAATINERDVCPGCGVPSADMDDPLKWATTARECVHCEAKERHRQAIPEDARDRVHITLVPFTEA